MSNSIRLKALSEFLRCKKNPMYFIKSYVFTYDVETQMKRLFARFPENFEFTKTIFDILRKIHDRVTGKETKKKHLIIEKSRQMYITWTVSAYITWMMLFKEGSQVLVTSEKASKIDKAGDLNTLLGRVDYIVKNLPAFLKPSEEDYINNLMHRGLRSINTMIVGDAGTEPGRAGSYDLTIADEFAFQSFTHLKYASMIEATKKSIILISTPNGKHNKFYELQKIAKEDPNSSFEVITLHWSKRRSLEWYEEQKKNYIGNESALLQELEIKYDTVTTNRVFKYFDTFKHVIDVNLANIKIDDLYVGADFGWSDPSSFIFLAQSGDKLIVIDEFEINETPVEIVAKEIKNRLHKLNKLNFDLKKVIFYGDPSGESRGRETGVSFFDLYRKNGINFLAADNSVEQGIVKINTLLAENKLFISRNCNRIIDALNEARYHVDKAGNIVGNKYKNDWYIHSLDALRYACVMQDRFNKIKSVDSTGSLAAPDTVIYKKSIFKDYFRKERQAARPLIIKLT